MAMMSPIRSLSRFISLATLVLLYFGAGKLGLHLAFVNASASAVWPPTGLAIAGLLVLGLRAWPAVFLGAFLVNVTTAGTILSSLGIATGNTLEGVCGAWLVSRFAHGRHAFDRVPDVLKFALLAGIAATTISSTIGVTVLGLAGLAAWPDFGAIWRTWWFGDAAGALLVAPLVITWAANPRLEWERRNMGEAVAAIGALLIAGGAIFGEWFPFTEKSYPLLFLLLPLLVWVGCRFRQRETATAMFVLSAVAITGTLRGHGPFALQEPNESLLLLQAFIGTIATMSLTLTAAISERRDSEQRLLVQQETTRILTESLSLSEAMPKILETICEKLDWEVGNFWRISADGEQLECSESWCQPHASLEEFIAVSRRTKLPSGIGMPGRAWANQAVVWIDDVISDSNFPRAASAQQSGLHSAFAFPVQTEGRVFGIMEFFTREFRGSKEELLAMVAAIGGQIGQVAERRKAQEMMKQSETLYRTIAETASDTFLTIDQTSTILFVNQAAERTFGYSADEMIGQKLTMLMPEELRPMHLPGVERYLTTGGRGMSWHAVEFPGRHKNGRVFPLEISIGDFVQDGQRIFTGIARDISERKRTEVALAQHAAIIESSQDAIYSKTLEGIVTSWNKAAELLFGYSADEIVGKDVRLLVPADRLDEERKILMRVGRGERLASYETVRRRKNASLVDVSLTISPIKFGDRITGASAIARDITDRKRAAAELEQQKLSAEAANHAKDIFLAMLSHELRAPLSPVVATIDDLETIVADNMEARRGLSMIRRNIEHEARMIDDLLDLTRIVQGKLDLRREPLDLHACVINAVELCRSEISHKQIDLQTDLRAAKHWVNADPTKVQQIVWNLVRNAVKFSFDGGVVAVSTANESTSRIAVRVIDRGIGIEPGMLRRIFAPFEQGERSINRRYGGLGLGLAISKALAEAHGGTLTAASDGLNMGATLTLSLDTVLASTLPEKSDGVAPIPERSPANLRILLVDDHEDTRQALERLLQRRGYQVAGAGDARSALALAAEGSFDLLVSDIGLPDQSGLHLIQEIQRLRPIKGIAVSGFGMEGDLEKSRAAGFSEHLLKPVNFRDLEAAIWQTIGDRRDSD